MNYREYNDSELLSYIKDNNEDANEIMFKKYKPLIKSLASKYYPKCQNKGYDLSDLIQEGMVGLSYAISSFDDDKDTMFYTYAKTCIERRMKSVIVSTERLKNKILNDSLPFETPADGINIIDMISDDSINPENLAISYEDEQDIYEEAKNILTSRELQVFELKISGFDYKEIADILDVDSKVIDNALQRIRSKMRKVLKQN